MCLGRPKKILQASEVEKLRKIQVRFTVKLRNFYQYFYVKKIFFNFPSYYQIEISYDDKRWCVRKLESYKQMMTTVMSGGWMNFSVLGMRVKLESVEKFLDKMKGRGCHE